MAAGGYERDMAVLIGTSGWKYRDWRGMLYPPGLAQRRWLEHYASRYATVENNGSFYRLSTLRCVGFLTEFAHRAFFGIYI